MNLEVLYEDENILAVNKPAGFLVHGHINTAEETVVTWIRTHRPDIRNVGDEPETRPGIVHRLDKDTSGVLLIAKTQDYFLYLKSLFQKREIVKTYLAFAWGVFREKHGLIDKPIGIVSGSVRRSIHVSKMAKPAITEYRVRKIFDLGEKQVATLLEIIPKTGRTHQIRVHLASIGHPIVGDPLYGGVRKEVSRSRLLLHALSVEFAIVPGRRLRIEAAFPEDFKPPELSTPTPMQR